MLKFDHFETSPVIEGYQEFENIHGKDNPKDGSYMDVYSKFNDNEQKLIKATTDFVEHTDAYKYCMRIKGIGMSADGKTPVNNDPTTFYIKNPYITGNSKTDVKINKDNKNQYSGINTPCARVEAWNQNTNGPIFRDVNPDMDISNFGNNVITDVSYINILTQYGNQLVTDLSRNYQNSQGADWKVNYNTNLATYNNNIKLRNDLDQKMVELYNGDQSIAMYQKKSVDSVVYANILWTILATSLIYYVFVKI